MPGTVAWMERRQVPLALGALVVGAAAGLGIPGSAGLAVAITPVLAALLFATFLAVPFPSLAVGLRDGRFLIVVGVVNFLIAPALAFVVSRAVGDDPALVFGVLLVLLTPCVDYVIVFTRLAGGDAARLLAATPLLMLAQLALLPVYLGLFVDAGARDAVEIGPFVEAFAVLIALPLAAAAAVQLLARRSRAARTVEGAMTVAMVPLLLVTLALVVASQMHAVTGELGALSRVVPLYVAFAAVMTVVGIVAARVARVPVPAARAVVFSGVTRNSLVVLPLALALPPALALAPLVVVTQTLVELVAMVALVRVVPRLLPGPAAVGPDG